MANKKSQTTEEIYTRVVPVIFADDRTQVHQLMELCAIRRALTYNKLGSLQGWGLDWRKTDRLVRTILVPSSICGLLLQAINSEYSRVKNSWIVQVSTNYS
jgi:hypothetical protein